MIDENELKDFIMVVEAKWVAVRAFLAFICTHVPTITDRELESLKKACESTTSIKNPIGFSQPSNLQAREFETKEAMKEICEICDLTMALINRQP